MRTLNKDIAFVGVGGCGTNIAFLFEKAGYTAIHINSSQQDESAIKGAKNIRHLKGFNGCAGDRRLAAKAMAKNIEIVDELLEVEEEFIFLVWGAGGGTGSGIARPEYHCSCSDMYIFRDVFGTQVFHFHNRSPYYIRRVGWCAKCLYFNEAGNKKNRG